MSAENIVQEFFVKLWEKRESLDVSVNLKSYMYASVKNLSLNFLKREDFYSSEENEFCEEDAMNPGELLEESEMNQAVHKAINELPQKCREIFIMCRFDHLSYNEIAEIQGVSVNTVKTQLKRSMKALSQKLAHIKLLISLLLIILMEYFKK